jgi:arsenate reductase (glutaredoxin)
MPILAIEVDICINMYQSKIMITMYGIKNCVTIQKARKWLSTNGIEYDFWDYKTQGVSKELLAKWCGEFGWEKVLNRSGMMWRKAPEASKNKVIDEVSAIDFMFEVPTAIKRPILETKEGLLIGFDEKSYNTKLI